MTQGPGQPDKPEGPPDGIEKPSVWPVHLMAVLLACSGIGSLVHLVTDLMDGLTIFAVLVTFPAYAFLTAWGLVRLRPWGWWCATALITGLLATYAASVMKGAPTRFSLVDLLPDILWFLIIVFLVWTLATRRRLFFTPKPSPHA